MRRRTYPNYAARRTVAVLLLLLALVISMARGCDAIFHTDYSPTTSQR